MRKSAERGQTLFMIRTDVLSSHYSITDAALAAGRQPQDIRRIYNVMGFITDGPVQGLLTVPVDYWVDELTRLAVEVGMDTFIYWPADDRLRQIERFAAEVVSAVQEQVARTRDLS